LIASAVLHVALKAYERISENPEIDIAAIMDKVISFANLDSTETKLAFKEMLSFSKNFDKQYPNFKHLKLIYKE